MESATPTRPNVLYIHSHDTGRYIQPYGQAIATPNLQALAELYTKNGKFKEGLAVDQQLCQRLPSDDLAWYNLGCSYALTNQPDEAFEALTRSVELGYGDYDWMKSDPDLLNLHKDPRFESLLSWLYSACYEEE